jgi:hypothetical protein
VGVFETPVVNGDKIYTTAGSVVYAFADSDDSATALWSIDLGVSLAITQPVLTEQGAALIVASKDSLWSINTAECDGTVEKCVLWTASSPQTQISRGLSLVNDGNISFGTQTGIQVLKAGDGSMVWSVSLQTLGVSAPVIMPNGRLIVGAKDGFVRAIYYSPNVAPASSPWPVMNHSQKRNAIAN